MLRLEMLPAEHGDALLLEYGKGSKITHRTLIDAGPANSYRAVRERLLQIPVRKGKRPIELLIVSHIDGDHIEGVVKLLQDDELALEPTDTWFNDWNHLEPLEKGKTPTHLGAEAGEFLGALLDEQGRPWNKAFKGGTVVIPEPGDGPLPVRTTKGGLQLTLLSPTVDRLIDLRKTWKKAIEAAGFEPGDRKSALRQFAKRRWAKKPTLGDETIRKTLDHAKANGSSIAVLAHYRGRRLLLGADAFADVLRPALDRWLAEPEQAEAGLDRVVVDGFKLAHHGSQKNMTPQLLEKLRSPVYLVSTSGARFRHPDRVAIEQVLAGHGGDDKPVLLFNYRSAFTKRWADNDLCESHYEGDSVLELETTS